jgi:tRNA (guanine10-N2)-dimethyltransferase
VVDPFLGTGALLAEAGILGARVSGVDRDPEMVRGALRNFEHLGLTADRLVVGDAAEAFVPNGGRKWDALISDVPYGRASTTKGEAPSHLLQRVLVEWAPLLKRRGRMAIVVPRGTPLHIADWSLTLSIEERRHRSLNREFRVYVHSSNQ